MTPEQRRWFWKGYLAGRSRSAARLRAMAMQFWDEADTLRTDLNAACDELEATNDARLQEHDIEAPPSLQ
jgi:hypothetical protein